MDHLTDNQVLFYNRRDAGRQLSSKLENYKSEDTVVIALPKGGDMVGYEVAKALDVPFDVIVVERICAPGYAEFAIGALAEGGVRVLDKYLIQWLGVSETELEQATSNELANLNIRTQLYRKNRNVIDVKDKTVILVDDSLTTGLAARAAVQALRLQTPKEIILAVPVSAPESALALRPEVDDFITIAQPADYTTKALWYKNLQPITDEQVIELIENSEKNIAYEVDKDDDEDWKNFSNNHVSEQDIQVVSNGTSLRGILLVPINAKGIVVFVPSAGSNRFSSRNRYVAQVVREAGYGTLMLDLYSDEEQEKFIEKDPSQEDIKILAKRLDDTVTWLKQNPYTKDLKISYYGANIGGAAAMHSANNQLDMISTVINRGVSFELIESVTNSIKIPVLLVVGEHDLESKRSAEKTINKNSANNIKFKLIPKASSSFEEPGTLDYLASFTVKWLDRYM